MTREELKKKLATYEAHLNSLNCKDLSDVTEFRAHWESIEFFKNEIDRINMAILIDDADAIINPRKPKPFVVTTNCGVLIWEICKKCKVESLTCYFNIWKWRSEFKVVYFH